MISKYGPGTLMAKFDVESAYQKLAIHLNDRYFLGMKWRYMYYVDLALPFGLRSAPDIFNSVADLVDWILVNNYHIPDFLHCSADYITAGPPNPSQCEQNLPLACSVCAGLGLPLRPSKLVSPSTCMVSLGIELDSVNQPVHLPCDELSPSPSMGYLSLCTKPQLQSLIGHIHYAALPKYM